MAIATPIIGQPFELDMLGTDTVAGYYNRPWRESIGNELKAGACAPDSLALQAFNAGAPSVDVATGFVFDESATTAGAGIPILRHAARVFLPEGSPRLNGPESSVSSYMRPGQVRPSRSVSGNLQFSRDGC